MSDAPLPSSTPRSGDGTPASSPAFRAVLRPNRSLSQSGFVIVMAIITVISFVAGVAFAMIGAWPVLGFFGLDVIAIYIAFKLNYARGRAYETIEINGSTMTLTRVDPKGRWRSIDFNPYWATVRLWEVDEDLTRIAIASHGQSVEFGQFLTNEERIAFADVLRAALQQARTAAPRT